MADTKKIKLHGNTARRVGVNGKFFEIPAGQEFEAEPEVVSALLDSGVAFSEVASEGAASQEGSGEVAPADTPPAMLPQSLESNYANGTGTQPGNVVAAQGGDTDASEDNLTIAERAEISDIRVAAERRTTGKESPAELAGEGEQGTEEAQPQPYEAPKLESEDEPEQPKAKKARGIFKK